jgi:nitrate reductase cytochrome c-type subunit
MKNNKLFQFLTMAICAVAFAFVTGCEGPVGPPGADGADGINGTDGQDGVDGNVTCLECHNQDNFNLKVAQFARSSHYGGEVDESREEWSSSCVRCHTDQGFYEYTEGLTIGGLTGGSNEFVCATCHSIHESFTEVDFALRKSDAVDFIFDETVSYDAGNSNLCVNCHQSRRAEPNIDSPGTTFFISNTHYGPHHGPQGNVLAGVGFAEIAGSIAYPTAGSATHYTSEAVRCTGCHMTGAGDDGEGGHTFMPAVEACTTCHAGATSFDIGGAQTANQALLDQIEAKLLAAGVIDSHGEPVVGTYPMAQAQAFFNWIGLKEDRSLGAHNPGYVKALLTNTLEAL